MHRSTTTPDAAGLALLLQLVQQLSMSRRLEDLTAIVRAGARALAGADGATVVLREGDLCHYADEDAIQPLWKGRRFPMETCVSGWAMLNRQPAVIPDIYQDARVPIDAYRPTFVKSLVMVPIRRENPIGAIGTYWARPQTLPPERVALLQALADTTSVAMENVQLVHDLERRVRERTAALEQANEALEAFSVSVSHDLRAPLRAVQGFAQLIDERAGVRLDDEGRHLLAGLRQAAGRMDVLMDDLMQLAQVGRRQPVCQTFDLAPMAREVLDRLQAAEPQRRVSTAITSPLPVFADPGLLRLALENLIGNAWKYSGRREDAQITVSPWSGDAGGRGFCVRDNGAGFDMARAERLFEPFRRLHSDDEFSGTGIGLAIVRRVVQQHGGRIHAEARKGEGATFYVALPGA